jgi:adenylate cyclase
MASEIEHKFLVRTEIWRPGSEGVLIRQGYLSVEKERVVRVRTAGSDATLTIKGKTEGISRQEFEYRIPLADATFMLDTMCLKPVLSKTRYRERVGAHDWEIDVFHAENDGLIVAEVEVGSEAEQIEMPSWAGREVSDDPRYFNANLAVTPFKRWSDRATT